MKILLDACVDWRLLRDLTEYDAKSAKQVGLERIDDGRLLSLATAAEFNVFITVDKDLPYEQNLANFDIAVIVLRGRTTRLPDLRLLLAPLHEAIRRAKPREVQIVNWRNLR